MTDMTESLADQIATVQNLVRQRPADDAQRVHLFQLLAQAGLWKKALAQLQVAAQINDRHRLLAQAYRLAIRAELLRVDVFQGTRSPQVLGQPLEWLGLLIEAIREDGQGRFAVAAMLRDAALEASQALSGRIDEMPFKWISDADARIGPVLEVYTHGDYYWLPFESIVEIRLGPPEDLRDLVWLPAHVKLINEGFHPILLPVRYPLAEGDDEADAHLRSRLTSWSEREDGEWIGHGVKLFATNAGDFSILDARHIRFDARSHS